MDTYHTFFIIFLLLLIISTPFIFYYSEKKKEAEKEKEKKEAEENRIKDIKEHYYEFKNKFNVDEIIPRESIRFAEDELIYLSRAVRVPGGHLWKIGKENPDLLFISLFLMTNHQMILFFHDTWINFNLSDIEEVKPYHESIKIKFKNNSDYNQIGFGLFIDDIVKVEKLLEKFNAPVKLASD